MLVASLLAHRVNGFFVFREGCEYVLVLGVVSLALGMLGPGWLSLDHAAGIATTGWAGGGIALVLGAVGTAGLLATCYRRNRSRRRLRSNPEAQERFSEGGTTDAGRIHRPRQPRRPDGRRIADEGLATTLWARRPKR